MKKMMIILLPFIWLWKITKAIYKYILILLLFIFPIFVILHLFKIGFLNNSNWGEIVGGCLGYYGTLVLGLVAILQTQISLKQNAETFIADKYSSIKILKDCSFQLVPNTQISYDNCHEYPINQFYVNSNGAFSFDKDKKLLKLKLFYKTENYPINSIFLKEVIENYKKIYFVDNQICTDLTENPEKECGQMEIVFIFSEEELEKFNQLFNEGLLILNFNFKIISSFYVLMNEKIEVNFGNICNEQNPIKFDENEIEYIVGTTSYKYIKGDKLWNLKNKKLMMDLIHDNVNKK